MPPLEPPVQYVHTADGVRIAYRAINAGPPLVVMPSTPFSHVQLEWDIADCRDWYERLGAGHLLVRYDPRGFGLSSRRCEDFSLEGQLRDLDAVIERLGLDPFALFASGEMGPAAIAYAAHRPGRVTHLVLWCSWARRADVSQSAQSKSLRALIEQDWQIYTETTARVLLGWGQEGLARQFAAFYRECTSPEVLRVAAPAIYEWDASALLGGVSCPVLVVHRKGIQSVGIEVAADLAAGVRDGQMTLLEGTSPLPWVGNMGAVLTAVRGFLGDESGPVPPEAVIRPASVTILFTDIEGSTDLTQRLGDAGAQEVLRAHNRIVRDALKAHGGAEIKHTGDGIMASFTSATAALECAVAIQRAFASHNESSSDTPIRVRIGLNAGEPVAEDDPGGRSDLFGTAVQLAARVCASAEAGQILVSNVVRELAAGKDFLFSNRGDVALRGFEDPVRLYEVRWGT